MRYKLLVFSVWMELIFPMRCAAADVAASTSTLVVSVSTFNVTASSVPVPTTVWRSVTNTAFESGEDFFFVISWGVITGGYSSLSVHGIETVQGRPAYHLVEDANSAGVVDTFYHVHDRNDAWLDTQALVTVRYEKRVREGKYRVEETGLLDQLQHRYAVHSNRIDKNTYEDKQGYLTPDVLDALGSLYYVRTLPMVVGQSYTMDVFSGEKVYPLVVKIKKREIVKVPAGKFDCFVVEPLLREPGIFVSKGKKLEVWLTADDRHMPVRMRTELLIGHVSAALVSYHKVSPPRP